MRNSNIVQNTNTIQKKHAIENTNMQYKNTIQNSLRIYRLQSHNTKQGNYVKNPITQGRISTKLNEDDEIL